MILSDVIEPVVSDTIFTIFKSFIERLTGLTFIEVLLFIILVLIIIKFRK